MRQQVFATGRHVNGRWTTAWVKPKADTRSAVEQHMLASLGMSCVRLFHCQGKVRAVANDRLFIGYVIVAEEVTEIPPEVLALVGQ